MATQIVIDDPADDRVDDFRDLKRADRRPDRPGGKGLVIAEGTVVVRRMLASSYQIRAVLGVRRRVDELHDQLAGVNSPAYVASADVMAAVVGFHLNRGVLAVADRVPRPSVAELAATARTVAVLEGVGDHENIGSLFRNAAALGVDGVVLGDGCCDPLYRRSVRVSMGHVLRVPFAAADEWPEALKTLRDNGFRVAAMTPRPNAASLHDVVFPGSGRIAVLLGAEGDGLSDAAIDASDVALRIPMPAEVDSLNVATAGAIAFYELANRVS